MTMRASYILEVCVTVALSGLIVQPARSQVVPAEQLKIKVNAGEGDTHHPDDKHGTTIEIQVLNEVDLPQPGATVVFQAPTDGPGIVFSKGGLNTAKVMSDDQGIARIGDIFGNKVKGPVTITVTAEFEGKKGTENVNQVNEPRFFTAKNKSILAGIAGAAAVILYETLKPGPPTATIGGATATATAPPAARIALPGQTR